MASKLLLEIGTEELPARYCNSILRQLSNAKVNELADKNNIVLKNHRLLLSPRRIVILADEVLQKESHISVKGPLKEVAEKNKSIIEKWLEKNDAESYIEKEENGKTFLYIEKDISKEFDNQVNEFANSLIKSLSFDRVMRWDDSGLSFARPIRWIVCLNDSTQIKIKIGNVESSNITYGNRFKESPEIKITKAQDYLDTMRKNFVIVDHDERLETIDNTLKNLTQGMVECMPEKCQPLRHEVKFLVEYPLPIMCQFDEKLLKLPQEVIVSVLTKHQKYFPLSNSNGISNYFLVIANHEKETEIIKSGNEKIINGRLRDAEFSMEGDKRNDVRDFLEKSKTIAFQEKLGSMWDKAQRIKKIAVPLAKDLGISEKKTEKLAEICKADLATHLVMEFTSLEGTIGRIYFGEEALEEYYYPRDSDDPRYPHTPEAQILAVADRIDSIYGLFSVGLKPKGNSDPYGLRRAAIALVRILWETEIKVSISRLIELAAKAYKTKADTNEIIEFIYSRLEQYVKDLDIYKKINDYNLATAILHNTDTNIARKKLLLQELESLKSTTQFQDFMEAVKRIYNIAIKDKKLEQYKLKPKDLNRSESKLLQTIEQLSKKTDSLTLKEIADITPIITDFFETNMVLSEIKEEKNRRLELLRQTYELTSNLLNAEYLFS